MTQETQGTMLLVDQDGAVYEAPRDAVAPFRMDQAKWQERISAHKANASGDTAGYWQSGYTVQRGDSLWAIAQRLYGDGSLWPYLFAANADQIRNPNLIFPGQVLRIG
jgi:nucleoid-associated protein YgaU